MEKSLPTLANSRLPSRYQQCLTLLVYFFSLTVLSLSLFRDKKNYGAVAKIIYYIFHSEIPMHFAGWLGEPQQEQQQQQHKKCILIFHKHAESLKIEADNSIQCKLNTALLLYKNYIMFFFPLHHNCLTLYWFPPLLPLLYTVTVDTDLNSNVDCALFPCSLGISVELYHGGYQDHCQKFQSHIDFSHPCCNI